MEFIFIILGIFIFGIILSGLKSFCGLSDESKNNTSTMKPPPHSSNSPFKSFSELIEYNADMIQRNENKDKREATYLAICTIYDDLRTRQNGKEGIRDLMSIVLSNYSELLNEISTYAIWKYESRLAFDEEFSMQMEERHRTPALSMNAIAGALSVATDKRGTFINYAEHFLRSAPNCHESLQVFLPQLVDKVFEYSQKYGYELADEVDLLEATLYMCVGRIAKDEVDNLPINGQLPIADGFKIFANFLEEYPIT